MRPLARFVQPLWAPDSSSSARPCTTASTPPWRSPMSLLPLFLDLRGKRVLVVGGGSVAQAKLAALQPTGCRVRAVSLAFSPAFLDELEGFDSERHDRAFRPDDLDGVHLVISATNDPG